MVKVKIPEDLLKFKFHILSALILSTLAPYLTRFAPSFMDVLGFFWPLLVSTSLFLVAVAVFERISMPNAEASGDNVGESILDFVACGEPAVESGSGMHKDE